MRSTFIGRVGDKLTNESDRSSHMTKSQCLSFIIIMHDKLFSSGCPAALLKMNNVRRNFYHDERKKYRKGIFMA